MANVTGTNGNDFIHVSGDGRTPPGGYVNNPGATDAVDSILAGEGDDIIFAGGGSDSIFFGDELTGADKINGGEGTDTIFIEGSSRVVFAADSLVDIERLTISFSPPPLGTFVDYALTFADANIAAGRAFELNATAAGADAFVFADFSHETDAGVITVRGGVGSETIVGRNADVLDSIDFTSGGADQFTGAGAVRFGNAFGASDRVNGLDRATVRVTGDAYDGASATPITGVMLNDVNTFIMSGAFSYWFRLADDNVVDAGKTLLLDSFEASGGVTFDAHAETDGAINFFGGIGDDSITGGGGSDYFTVSHGAASDYGDDTVLGGAGDDTLQAAALSGADVFNGGAGDDLLLLNPYLNDGSTFVDMTLTAANFIDVERIQVGGFQGEDMIFFLNVMDNGVVGGALTVDATRLINGFTFIGSDPDSAYAVTGGDGADTLVGGSGIDTLVGGAGNDALDGGNGADVMRGGAGDDTYYVASSSDIVIEAVGEGADTVSARANYTLGDNIETLVLANLNALSGTGNGLANELLGNSGNNILDGKAGADTMTGGLGDDTYFVNTLDDVVVENANGGYDSIRAGLSMPSLAANVERLILLGSQPLSGVGNGLDNTIIGNSANNTLNGGAGLDRLFGGLGNDRFFLDEFKDRVYEYAGEGVDSVFSSANYYMTPNIERATLTGATAIRLLGNDDLGNILTGNGAANVIDGKAGADTMIGGAGDDLYYADNAGDAVTELAGEGNDTLRSTIARNLDANVENLILRGSANINGNGNALNNKVIGNAGNNVLNGLAGNDNLTGGAGADAFAFTTAPDTFTNRDRITDFNVADDTIRLEGSVFTAVGPNGVLAAAAFYIGAAAHDGSDRIVYNSSTGVVFYDPDGTGATAAVQMAVLSTGLALTNADFLVI